MVLFVCATASAQLWGYNSNKDQTQNSHNIVEAQKHSIKTVSTVSIPNRHGQLLKADRVDVPPGSYPDRG